MAESINPKNFSWTDGWSAVGIGIVGASATANQVRHRINRPQRLKQARLEKFNSVLNIKRAVDSKTISKQIGAEMCTEVGVDPLFLDNKEFQEIFSYTKKTLSNSNKPPMATISFLHSNTTPYSKKESDFWADEKGSFSHTNTYECFDEYQNQRPMEYTQMAVVPSANNHEIYSSGNGKENLLVMLPICGAAFVISSLSYYIGVTKLKNTAWYQKNFSSDQAREEWYKHHVDITYEKIEKLNENQKEIVENQKKISQNQDELLKNQNQILKLLTKN